ncbi:unnamed protein product [Cochlearia groenlandica]
MRFGTGKEAERLRNWAEIRQAFDELKLSMMAAEIIASKQTTSHDEQKQFDDNKEMNLAESELLVSRVADTHVVGSVFEVHVEPNLAISDEEDHAHQVFDQMSKKSVKRKKKKWKRFKYKRLKVRGEMRRTRRKNKFENHIVRLKSGKRVLFYACQMFDKMIFAENRAMRTRKRVVVEYNGYWMGHHVLDDMWLRTMWRKQRFKHKYKSKKLDEDKLLQISKMKKLSGYNAWTSRESPRLKGWYHMRNKKQKSQSLQVIMGTPRTKVETIHVLMFLNSGKGHKFRHKHKKKIKHMRKKKIKHMRKKNIEVVVVNKNCMWEMIWLMWLHKKQVMKFLTFHKGETFVRNVFRLKKRTRLLLERKFSKHKNCIQALVSVILLWECKEVEKKQRLKNVKRAKFMKDHMKVIRFPSLCKGDESDHRVALMVDDANEYGWAYAKFFVQVIKKLNRKKDKKNRFGHLFWLFIKKHIKKERVLISERRKNKGRKECQGKHLWSCSLDMSTSNSHLDDKLLNTTRFELERIQTTQHNKQQQWYEDLLVEKKKSARQGCSNEFKDVLANQFSNSNLEDKFATVVMFVVKFTDWADA